MKFRRRVMLRLSRSGVTSVIVLSVLLLAVSAGGQHPGPASPEQKLKLKHPAGKAKQVGPIESQADRLLKHEREYEHLYSATIDKAGLESIRELHMQLDDDKDGSIEPSETGDFIRGDLGSKTSSDRQKKFHGKDSEITVNDLWHTWRKGEVHNWTVTQTVDWLTVNVELPQYAEHFRRHGVNGSLLPQVAINSQFLNKVVGVSNPIHRSKITLKAMDVVLFGPPKDPSNPMKDWAITSLLALAISLIFYAYKQNKQSRRHMQKMMVDMDGLAKAEKELQELQSKLQQRDSELEISMQQNNLGMSPDNVADQTEVSRLREEVEVLRNELQRAEVELEDKCWMASPVLQHWLQLTYEIESASYNAKRKAAEEQLAQAKDMCDKLNKKRSSFVGAFVSTHGRSIDDVDKSILEAKTALGDVTKDLTERSQRWRQIEMLCGCSIVQNPGIAVLNSIVRHVGSGRITGPAGRAMAAQASSMSSRMSNRGSQDDLLMAMADANDDAHSIAASSSHMTSITSASSMARYAVGTSAASVAGVPSQRSVALHKAAVAAAVSTAGGGRDSGRDSSDELLSELKAAAEAGGSSPALIRAAVAKGPRVIGPGGRKMVKSFSQDASSTSFVKNAAMAMLMAEQSSIHPSASDSHLSSHIDNASSSHHNVSKMTSSPITKSCSPLASASNNEGGSSPSSSSSPPTLLQQLKPDGSSDGSLNAPTVKVQSAAAAATDSCEQLSDSASVTSSSTLDLATSGDPDKAKKKRRSFFNFRRSKDLVQG